MPESELIHLKLLTPAEAAERFGVGPKAVVRWANLGRFPAEYKGRRVVVRTGGGHHRFDEQAVTALAEGRLQWTRLTGGDHV